MNIKTDAAFNKLMSQFLERLQELDEKIDHFAVNELKAFRKIFSKESICADLKANQYCKTST